METVLPKGQKKENGEGGTGTRMSQERFTESAVFGRKWSPGKIQVSGKV